MLWHHPEAALPILLARRSSGRARVAVSVPAHPPPRGPTPQGYLPPASDEIGTDLNSIFSRPGRAAKATATGHQPAS